MSEDADWVCSCGHGMFSHYMHCDEYYCKYCKCEWCDAPVADDFRARRAEAKARHPQRFWASEVIKKITGQTPDEG